MPMILYQRDECHLCDLALEAMARAGCSDFESVYIDGDAELEARYGVRVPVLVNAAGGELNWPFNAASIRDWLDASG